MGSHHEEDPAILSGGNVEESSPPFDQSGMSFEERYVFGHESEQEASHQATSDVCLSPEPETRKRRGVKPAALHQQKAGARTAIDGCRTHDWYSDHGCSPAFGPGENRGNPRPPHSGWVTLADTETKRILARVLLGRSHVLTKAEKKAHSQALSPPTYKKS